MTSELSQPAASNPNFPGSNSTQKVVQLSQFAPAAAAVLLVCCLSKTLGFLPRDGSAAFAISLLTAALFCCVAALVFPNARLPRFENVPILCFIGRDPVLAVLCAGLIFQWFVLCDKYFATTPQIGCLPAFAALMIWSGRQTNSSTVKIWRGSFLGVLLLFALCLVGVLLFEPTMPTDVMVFQRDSSHALASGKNPYAMTFPDIYKEESSTFYGPGASVGGVLQFGFPYLPLTLLWVLPAQILLGDFRFAYVLALVIAAAFLWNLQRNAVVAASLLLLLFSAPTFFVLQHGWTEPLPVMLLCVVAWAARRRTSLNFFTVGVLAAAKQYLILLLPLTILLPPEKPRDQRIFDGAKAAAVASLITLPFVLWNPRAFFHSALFIQIAQPFRDSSLSYLSYFKLVTGTQPPSWPGFLVAIIALAFCLKCAPRTTTGFALSVAVVMFGFISFARQAFINYYFLIFGALCCATALANSESENEIEIEIQSLTLSDAAAEQ